MPEAKRTHGQARPRSSGNWSFRESASSVASQLPVPAPERRHRNSKAEIRRVRKLGGTILVVHAEGPPAARRASVPSACQARGESLKRTAPYSSFRSNRLTLPVLPLANAPYSENRRTENCQIVPARTEILNRPAKTEPSDNRRIATNKNGRTKIGLGGRPFRRGERIPRSAKKPGGRYGTKLGSFTSRRPDEGKIAIILSWYVSCI